MLRNLGITILHTTIGVKKAGPAGGNPDALLDVADTFDGTRGDNPPQFRRCLHSVRVAHRDVDCRNSADAS